MGNRSKAHFEIAHVALEQAQAAGIGRTLKISRLERAIRHFNQSLQTTAPSYTSKKDRLMGLSDAQLGLVHVVADDTWTGQVVASVKHALSEALSTADALLPTSTSGYVRQEVMTSIQTLMEKAACMPTAEQRLNFFRWLHSRLLAMNERQKLLPSKLMVYGYWAGEVYHQALRDFEGQRWAKALNALRGLEAELATSVELEDRLVDEGELDDGEDEDHVLRDLKSDVDLLVLSCEGSQLLHNGDQQFARAMNCDPEDMLGWAQLAQDDYRGALSRVTERDIELEGMTLFRLARFHSKVTKLPTHAHGLYLRAVQLAAALAPALPKGTWYLECTNAVQSYRDELAAKEATLWHNRRLPLLAQLEPELQSIASRADLSNLDFARWVWAEWPPKTEGSEEFPPCPDEGRDTKKLYLKVIQRYHPDRNSKFGERWQVLSEEISKALNGRYGSMKM